ncbi:hypothetical protein [Massilia glaciei]|uniref:Lipoprotein n=1 Tax=Massilia glaciei TaxID=1524097 RepID=A0A2U2HKD5_9BURK|nr:hypothetical protein [Massilia glaciei]PWF47896.1 hypothetical protein C7C56_013625 [Massilia glaciei]
MAISPRTLSALSIAAIAGVLSACATESAGTAVNKGQHTLTQGQQVAVTPKLTLSFDNVNDSRCRKDMVCVWAGKIIYNFTLHGAIDETFSLSDNAPRYASPSHAGVLVTLANPGPAPLPAATDPAPVYAVTLKLGTTDAD